jgi:beta-fructofuranosidase
LALKLPDKWVWDFWFAVDGSDYHIFYLQAPRDLPDAELRHWHVTIGHAVSPDLVNWEILPDALAPAAEDTNAWDNFTTWTGSIIQHEGTWYFFYTGSNRAENGLIQRIGLATSHDLLHWQKYPSNPLIVADPQWYELLEPEIWPDHAWRDPWVFKHNGMFHAYITARRNRGPGSARGVIAHAKSADLINWEVSAPIATVEQFGYLEVPQLVNIEERGYLLFSVGHKQFSENYRSQPGTKLVTGTHYLVGDYPLGPFKLMPGDFLLGDEIGSGYSGKLIRDPNKKWNLMAFRKWAANGDFLGEVGDPMPIQIGTDGRLLVIK